MGHTDRIFLPQSNAFLIFYSCVEGCKGEVGKNGQGDEWTWGAWF